MPKVSIVISEAGEYDGVDEVEVDLAAIRQLDVWRQKDHRRNNLTGEYLYADPVNAVGGVVEAFFRDVIKECPTKEMVKAENDARDAREKVVKRGNRKAIAST